MYAVKTRKPIESSVRGGQYDVNQAATGSPSFAWRRQLLIPEADGGTGRQIAKGRPREANASRTRI